MFKGKPGGRNKKFATQEKAALGGILEKIKSNTNLTTDLTIYEASQEIPSNSTHAAKATYSVEQQRQDNSMTTNENNLYDYNYEELKEMKSSQAEINTRFDDSLANLLNTQNE